MGLGTIEQLLPEGERPRLSFLLPAFQAIKEKLSVIDPSSRGTFARQ